MMTQRTLWRLTREEYEVYRLEEITDCIPDYMVKDALFVLQLAQQMHLFLSWTQLIIRTIRIAFHCHSVCVTKALKC